ncbi:vesicle coat component [Neofusicoccum ribis]|uniref:Protein transport protein sec16 n=1 Tax=Neofusicoccum ribis TaxID=45134 RepID=A0ABR3SGH6_9PEZI
MDSSMFIDDMPSGDSPPPRTSEDRHPLNEDGPRFVFDEEDDEFAAWQNDADHADFGLDDTGARTPLADDRSATPQPPALASQAAESHDSETNVAEDSAITPVEAPTSVPIPEPAPVAEALAVEQPSLAPAEEAQPTPTIEHEQPDIETIDTEALHETNPAAETSAEHTQEHHYEHQGETTTLEEAVQESAAVPLADDIESPAQDWGVSEETFDLGTASPAAATEPQPEPETAHEIPAQTEPEPAHEPDTTETSNLDWGNAGDDAFDLEKEQASTVADIPAHSEQEPKSQPADTENATGAADLDWGAGADEDFSLGGQQTAATEETPQALENVHSHQAQAEETAAAPTLDWGAAEDVDFSLGTASAPSQEIPAQEPKTDAVPPTEQQSEAPNLDWGATGDDDFGFGATQTDGASQPAEKQSEDPAKTKEQDLSALWAEALADDDILEDSSVDPSAFFLDDDDGFLDDTPPSQNGAAQTNGAAVAPAAPASTNKYAPAVTQAPPAAPKNPYAPQGLQTTNVAQSTTVPAQHSPYGAYNQAYQQPPPQRPPMPNSAQSFADKAKGGYASPFDLPEDLAKQPARKKIVHAPTVPAPQSRAPPPRTSTSGDEPIGGHSRSSLELVREMPEQEVKPATPPPPPRSGPSSAVGSPARRTTANYTPQYQSIVSPPAQTSVPPLRRAQSQSPGATMKGPMLSMAAIDRPASTNGVTSPTTAASPYTPFAGAPPTSQPSASAAAPQQRRRRTFSRDLSYVKPTDETVSDPLERWKGAPIFKWGLGGAVLTSFPKEIPRYGTGTVLPMIKCTPGEVKLQRAKEICPLWDPISKFPGPLKTKSQKKPALTWLQQSIETMEKDYQSKIFNGELPGEVRIRFEEKILLWKVLEVFVEHDGHLEGSDAVNNAVRKILTNGQDDEPQLSSPVDIMGSAATTGSVNAAEPIDPHSVGQLRAHLLKGDREKAVWEAADKRLWGHAMLIASTMNKDIWKQVIQEFVRQEVRKVSGNNQSLAALYEVFAGNWEESIDELVPASARAGFQMVSKTDRSGANTNVLEGLDRWRETLLLIVNNRSDGDPQALVALGKLLAGYGRVEAAHICYLFARSAVILGGADDPTSHFVLLGADHVNQRFELGRDIEPILLTEIFEFAVSLSAPTAPPAIPHLQAFKLAHAFTLTEYGYRTEAQAYCDAIAGAMKSTTRLSPYYNASLVQELDDLIKRLSEAPKDGSSSWISKPTMGKVSSSVWSSFNKFVAGDDSDADSTNPGGNDTSPFAKVTGDTPSVSRSPSVADMYGTYSGGAAPLAPSNAIAGSRYAPASGAYAPRTSGEQPRSRYEPAAASPYQPVRPAADSGDRHEMPMDALFAQQGTPPSSYNPATTQFAQHSKTQNAYAPSNGPLSAESSPNPLGSPYTPTTSGFQPLGAPVHEEKQSTSYEPPRNNFGPPLNSYEPSTSSYEPPTSSYEPPSYKPYEPEPEPEEEQEEEKPKKKSFMDDDDDDELERRATALKAQQKAEADRQADEAFRKAAEADAAKPAAPKKTGSWLGGWFKKSESTDLGNKPIRAKLGEENSFYYDPDLKKWVNKKAGPAEASKPAGTPPPPKGPPGAGLRNSASMANLAGPPSSKGGLTATPPPPGAGPGAGQRSTSMPPPMAGASASAPGSGAATPARTGSPAVGGPPSAAGTPAGGPPLTGPPSRPATSMSNASSIDDLLGAPAPRKAGAAKKKGRSGRYVDVMAK